MSLVDRLSHSGPGWQPFWDRRKSQTTFGERTFAKFRNKNAVFINFCNKNVIFSITRYPIILKIFWVLLESTGSGRVSGTRQTVRSIIIQRRQKLLQTMMEDDFGGHSVHC